MATLFVDQQTAPLPSPDPKCPLWQFVRFCSVGILNTGLDLLLFNLLLWWWPTQNTLALLGYNSLAYFLGALDSFFWNKYWTFRERHTAFTMMQVLRFAIVTALGIVCNDGFLWLAGHLLTTLALSGIMWTNAGKVGAIGGSVFISYLGMRVGVFTLTPQNAEQTTVIVPTIAVASHKATANHPTRAMRSLSVVLPAYNEAATIVDTLTDTLATLYEWKIDFEVIVVDDGSVDQTAAYVQQFEWQDPRHVRLMLHQHNKGYGEALKTGFAHANKNLIFFMDADGQFNLQDLFAFFPLIEDYDAVLGYRLHRQDPLVRKCNAWCWNALVRFVFGIRTRDVDCAFKLFRGNVLQSLLLESGGAMLNTEILYKWGRRGATSIEVGVQHYPRRAGKATGAKLRVIARALAQLLVFAEKWRREELGEEIV